MRDQLRGSSLFLRPFDSSEEFSEAADADYVSFTIGRVSRIRLKITRDSKAEPDQVEIDEEGAARRAHAVARTAELYESAVTSGFTYRTSEHTEDSHMSNDMLKLLISRLMILLKFNNF